jgi:hypothetical protein
MYYRVIRVPAIRKQCWRLAFSPTRQLLRESRRITPRKTLTLLRLRRTATHPLRYGVTFHVAIRTATRWLDFRLGFTA